MSALVRIARADFAAIMEFLATSLGVSIEPRRQEAYYRMLSDLDPRTLWQAVCKIVSTRVYASLPLVGEIRRHAGAIRLGIDDAPTPVEAWEQILAALNRSEFDFAIECMTHPLLKEFLAIFGRRNWRALVYTDDRAAERRRFEFAYAEFLRHRLEELSTRVPEFPAPRAHALSNPSASQANPEGARHGNS